MLSFLFKKKTTIAHVNDVAIMVNPKDLSVNNVDRQPDLAQRDDRRQGGLAAIASVRTEVFGAALGRVRTLDGDACQHGVNSTDIVDVGGGDHQRQRDSTPVHQQMALAAVFFPDPLGWAPRLPVPTGL